MGSVLLPNMSVDRIVQAVAIELFCYQLNVRDECASCEKRLGGLTSSRCVVPRDSGLTKGACTNCWVQDVSHKCDCSLMYMDCTSHDFDTGLCESIGADRDTSIVSD